MSGGRFNYLYSADTLDMISRRDELQEIRKIVESHGYKDISSDINWLCIFLVSAEQKLRDLSKRIDALRDVLHAVELYESCDYSEEDMIKVFEKYMEDKNATD